MSLEWRAHELDSHMLLRRCGDEIVARWKYPFKEDGIYGSAFSEWIYQDSLFQGEFGSWILSGFKWQMDKDGVVCEMFFKKRTMGYAREMIKDCQRTQALQNIAKLRGIHVSAMRDDDLPVIDAITEEGIQTVFESLSALLDIAEEAVQQSILNEQARAWFADKIAALAE